MDCVVVEAEQFGRVLFSAEKSLFRLEMQSAYDAPGEFSAVERFINGDPQHPDTDPDSVAWRSQVQSWVSAGITVDRVRIHNDIPTNYQQWQRWAARWNIDAGETIRYIKISDAFSCGLMPKAGIDDWWIIDEKNILRMKFDDEYRLTHCLLETSGEAINEACKWRDLAISNSHPDEGTK